MIRVQVSEKQRVNISHRDVELPKTLSDAAADVKQQLLAPRYHKRAGAESIGFGWRASGTEERDPELLCPAEDGHQQHEQRCNDAPAS
jgi:hypothetical protein